MAGKTIRTEIRGIGVALSVIRRTNSCVVAGLAREIHSLAGFRGCAKSEINSRFYGTLKVAGISLTVWQDATARCLRPLSFRAARLPLWLRCCASSQFRQFESRTFRSSGWI